MITRFADVADLGPLGIGNLIVLDPTDHAPTTTCRSWQRRPGREPAPPRPGACSIRTEPMRSGRASTLQTSTPGADDDHMVHDSEHYQYVCPRCHRNVLFFWRPPAEPTCRRHRRWSIFGVAMIRV